MIPEAESGAVSIGMKRGGSGEAASRAGLRMRDWK